jgi:tRNA pseudouridine(55) synthase
MLPYLVLEKTVGQTPLEVLELYKTAHPEYANVPMAYAGRLDPMASGKLLVLVGEECKQQSKYHALDKEYVVAILFGVSSDSGDVLGLVETTPTIPKPTKEQVASVLSTLKGSITLPYPKFSSKTVHGKPLHTWMVEGRMHEITIPSYTATIHRLKLESVVTKTRAEIYSAVSEKIETIPPVTDPRKSLGNDFRRPEVRAKWLNFNQIGRPDDTFSIATIRCIGSSGLYMRTLAEVIAERLGTSALAYAIHRTTIGLYQPIPFQLGFWRQRYEADKA